MKPRCFPPLSPAEHVRIVLAEYRKLGIEFRVAWASAMRTLPRNPDVREWKRDLRWAKAAYQAAYEGGDYEVVVTMDGERTFLIPRPVAIDYPRDQVVPAAPALPAGPAAPAVAA